VVSLLLAKHGLPLRRRSLLLALARGLGLRTLGVHLLLELLLTSLLGLSTVNVLDEGALVLEGVTLAQVVELVVEVLVDLATSTVLDKQTTKDTETAHPEDLLGHTGIGGTLALSVATVATLTAGKVEVASTGAGVLGYGLADDEAIGDELSDRLAGVGVGDLALLVGVEPDLALAAADDRRGQALLSSQVDPVE
jgi:hypothetical protein